MKKIHIHGDDVISKIDRNIYGHFAEHIGGVYYDGGLGQPYQRGGGQPWERAGGRAIVQPE